MSTPTPVAALAVAALLPLAACNNQPEVVDSRAPDPMAEAIKNAALHRLDERLLQFDLPRLGAALLLATAAEAQAIDAAKSFLRRLRNALPRALRESPGSGVTASAFEVGDSLQRSTPKISKHLAAIRPAVVKLDPALTKHFNGQLASVLLDQVKAALDDADTTQEVTRKNAPVQTQALYEHMGRVLEQIEDLNRAGKSAFDGDSTMQGKFNKDILLRGRKTAKKTAPKDPKGDGAPVNGMQTPVSPAGGAQAPGAPS